MPERGCAPLRRLVLAVLTALALAGFSATAFGSAPSAVHVTNPPAPLSAASWAAEKPAAALAQNRGRPGPFFDNLSPEERLRMQRQYREWQSLPPEQKDNMRRRMDDWNRMPPQDRDRYQQRYRQWQQLSPDERQQLDNTIRRWDSLSPQERDNIRKRFNR